MAILNQPVREGESGVKKQLEAGSEEILFDFLQSAQYQYPIQSAIREITSNALDSIREKERFFKINSGEAKVEDYYIDREGEIYKDSKYDPSYYSEKWLSKTENEVKLIYKVNNSSQRDTFHILDTGVGLGGKRLEKHFNPLYSTKRNSKDDLGKFGLGSKSGLALNIDYYTLITRYNGMEFQFHVYSYKYDPIVPRFDMQKGKENPYYEMLTSTELVDGIEQPRKLYYYPTNKPNGVEVILQAKKGLRKEFIDAVKGQLLYMDNIKFEIEEDGATTQEKVKADIEYEDDIFVLPTADSTFYSKPHLILKGVCYGYINFLQMEEEDRAGNIGIKADPALIDVTPNRESVQYTEKTINYLKATFDSGKDIAEKLLNEALVSDDIIEWALKSATAVGGMNQTSVIGRFANIVDLKLVRPKFKRIPKLRYSPDPGIFFSGYEVLLVTPAQKWSKAKQTNITSLDRSKVKVWSYFTGKQIFYQDTETSFRQEMFMFSIYPNGFIKIIPKDSTTVKKLSKVDFEEAASIDELTWEQYQELSDEDKSVRRDALDNIWKNERSLIDQMVKDSKLVYSYSSVTVPEDFKVHEKEEDEDEEEAVENAIQQLTPEEKRKLQNRIVATSFHHQFNNYYRTKHEPRIQEIMQDKGTIIYGFQEDEGNLCLAMELFFNLYKDSWTDDLKIVMISQANAKYFKPHIFVNDFFMNFNPETKTISMHSRLVKWQTARRINDILPTIQFLTGFKIFDQTAHDMYIELVNYRNLHYVELKAEMHKYKNDGSQNEILDGLKSFTDKITDFQIFVSQHPNNHKAIASMSKALFETDDEGSFKDAIGIELEIYQKLLTLVESTQNVKVLLNTVNNLVNNYPIDFALEQEIKAYLYLREYIPLPKANLLPTTQAVDLEVIES